jgi:hypothetical protein
MGENQSHQTHFPRVSLEEKKTYRGMTVAVCMKSGKVLGADRFLAVAVEKALKSHPNLKREEIYTTYIPKADYVCF